MILSLPDRVCELIVLTLYADDHGLHLAELFCLPALDSDVVALRGGLRSLSAVGVAQLLLENCGSICCKLGVLRFFVWIVGTAC